MKTLLLTLVLLAQQTGTFLHLRVIDVSGKPMGDVSVTLELYTYVDQDANIWFEEVCQTDLDGRCEFQIESAPPDGGFLHGSLQVGDFGIRDVTWPGGEFNITIPVEQIGFGQEAEPYAFQQEDGGVEIFQRRGLPVYALIILLILVSLSVFMYRKARKEHA